MYQIYYQNAARGGGTEVARLSVLLGYADALPKNVEGLLLTSDLQGVAPSWKDGGELQLLGEVLAKELEQYLPDLIHLHSSQVGVILAGDLYSAPEGNKRGATGDVRTVWQTFAERFRWVAGVAGNHDTFGTPREFRRFREIDNIFFLDGDVVTVDSLRIGGVGGITGDPQRTGRRWPEDQYALIELVLENQPDLFVLHEGPSGTDPEQRGNGEVLSRLRGFTSLLTVCGHVHWKQAICATVDSGQILNVDARALLLLSSEKGFTPKL